MSLEGWLEFVLRQSRDCIGVLYISRGGVMLEPMLVVDCCDVWEVRVGGGGRLEREPTVPTNPSGLNELSPTMLLMLMKELGLSPSFSFVTEEEFWVPASIGIARGVESKVSFGCLTLLLSL